MDKDNITIGLPKSSGALYWAPAGTTLPTDASTALSSAFTLLGYVTEDGVTFTTTEEGNDIKAWGGDTVMHSQTGFSKTATFKLLETSSVAVLQFVFGEENVTVNDDGSMKWRSTSKQLPRGVMVCDTIHNNGSETPRYHRQVLGDAQFTDRSGDQTYNNSDPLAFPVVVTAYKFQDADNEYVYDLNFMTSATAES